MIRISSLFANTHLINPTEIGFDVPKDADTAFLGILNIVYAWAGIIAVLIIVIAGYIFLTARGDPTQIKRGKDAIRGAVIGLVVVMLAFVITQFILGRF